VQPSTPLGPDQVNVIIIIILAWKDVPEPWRKILEYISNGSQVHGMLVSLKQEQIPSYQDIMVLYMAEVIEKAEEARLDARPDDTPWA
jgi:hypothetical protein